MIRTKDVRARLGLTTQQISRYREAGLFSFDPIGVSHGGFGRDRVYPDEALTVLEVLEGLREYGFTLGEMFVLFSTGIVEDMEKGLFTFDENARLVIPPERIIKGGKVIKLVLKFYNRQPGLPRQANPQVVEG